MSMRSNLRGEERPPEKGLSNTTTLCRVTIWLLKPTYSKVGFNLVTLRTTLFSPQDQILFPSLGNSETSTTNLVNLLLVFPVVCAAVLRVS